MIPFRRLFAEPHTFFFILIISSYITGQGQEQGYGGNEQRGPPSSIGGQPYGQQNGHDQQQSGGNMPQAGASVASDPGAEADLLDVDNWDDVPLQDPPTPSSYAGYPSEANPQYAQQSSPYGNAIVPVVGGGQSYPGAPPPPQQYQQQQQQQYQQQYQQPPSPQQYQQQPPPQQYQQAPQQQYQQPPQQQYQQQQPQQYQEYQQPPPQQQQYQQPGMEAQQDPWATQ
jgi:hypothetical protein